MAKTTPRVVIEQEVEAAWRAGIMHTLVTFAQIDSAKANKLVDKVAARPNTLADQKRSSRERIVDALLAASVDSEKQKQQSEQDALF